MMFTDSKETDPVGMRRPSWTGWLSRGMKSSAGVSRRRHRHASYCRAPWEAWGNLHTASSMVSAGKRVHTCMKDINWKRGQFHLTLLNHGQWWRLRCLVLSRQLACKLKFYYYTFMNVLLVSKLQRIHILVTIRNKCWRVNLLSMLNTIEPAVYIDSFWSVSIANQFRRCRPI